MCIRRAIRPQSEQAFPAFRAGMERRAEVDARECEARSDLAAVDSKSLQQLNSEAAALAKARLKGIKGMPPGKSK